MHPVRQRGYAVADSGIDDFIAELRPAVTALVYDSYGAGVTVLPTPTARRRVWSTVVRWPLHGGSTAPRAVLTKVRCVPGVDIWDAVADDGLREQGWADYVALRRVEALIDSSPEHRSVRPLGFLERWGALVMEELDASSLKATVGRASFLELGHPSEHLITTLTRTGSLLRLIQEGLAPVRHVPIMRDELSETVDTWLHALSRTATAAAVAKIRDGVERARTECNARDVPAGQGHGNMSCANVLVGSDGRVSVIDFHTPQTAMYLHQDVARLVVDVEMIGIQVALALGRSAASRRASALRRAVLRGYAGTGEDDSVPTYFLLAAIADRWLAYDERLSLVAQHARPAVRLAVRWRRRLLQALAVTHADELEARLP